MADFLLPVHYLRQIAEQLRVMGADPADWLLQCGVEPRQLDDLSYQPGFPLFCRLIEHALELTDEPAFGLLLGERLGINTHGILGYAALQSESLRQAIQLVERYLAVRTTLVTLRHEHDEAAQLEHIQFVPSYPLGPIQQTVLEAVMLAIKNVFDAITPGSARVNQVNFPLPATDYADLASAMFNCPVAYAQPWAGFTFDSALLDLPLRMADPVAFREAEQICQRELMKLTEKTSLTVRIRRLMLEKQNGFPSLEVTARLFHMTPRTLHRHLLDEGTTFKLILEDVRRTLAVEHLKAGRLTVQEIAYSLGYSDVANFRRAFKRWEGVPPTEFR
ncbi:AraC family transcriptional regulator [Pseudomonas sp. BN415]|uniref:AraC family transcriptional regulator n=1 Tax=Pseudomonas sp. BN415 TaxID=2567889 RepID=UPI0024590D9D|nr:AraC family transcriptional regulator [Pseudomonas sp. BN415]MDH4585716.1 AraC family transcriptional regulator [Pseudomonas sp. BN415]